MLLLWTKLCSPTNCDVKALFSDVTVFIIEWSPNLKGLLEKKREIELSLYIYVHTPSKSHVRTQRKGSFLQARKTDFTQSLTLLDLDLGASRNIRK
jgi:tRNA A37 threonylcarbamoyladenosine biosynthesis protein TsaE